MPYHGVAFPNCPYPQFSLARDKYPGLEDLSDNQIAYLEVAGTPQGESPATSTLVLGNGLRLYPSFANKTNHNLPFDDYARGLDIPYLDLVDFQRVVLLLTHAKPEARAHLVHSVNLASSGPSPLMVEAMYLSSDRRIDIANWLSTQS